MSNKPKNVGDLLNEFREHRQAMRLELAKVVIGQDDVIEQLFAAIFTRGHCLLEGCARSGKNADGQLAWLASSTSASIESSLRPT